MTRMHILAAAAVVLSIIVIVEGVGLLHATVRAPVDARPSPTIAPAEAASDDRAARKGDRLPVATLTVESPQPEAAPSPEPSASPQLHPTLLHYWPACRNPVANACPSILRAI